MKKWCNKVVLKKKKSLYLSLSHTHTRTHARTHTHTHTHTHYICIYFFICILFTMLSYSYFMGNEQRHNKVLKVLSGTDPNHRCCIVAFLHLPNMLMWLMFTSISGAMSFLRGVWVVNVSLIRSVTNMNPAPANVQRLINWLSCIVCNTFLLPLHVSSIFSTAKEPWS